MNNYTLGLDVGPTSIGWSIIDNDQPRLIPLFGRDGRIESPGCGVRIFPECVDPKKNVSNNEQRRTARGMRRQIYRRAQRKKKLRLTLIEAGLYPADDDAANALERSFQDQRGNGSQFALYRLRAKALHELVTPYEFGRILIQLNQRRGFKSNRKSERGKRDGKVWSAINRLKSNLENGNSHSETLGEYLYRVAIGEIIELQETKEPEPSGKRPQTVCERKIRGRYTLRAMHEFEFDLLWTRQLTLTEDSPDDVSFAQKLRDRSLHDRLREIIFYQRPLKSTKHLIGRCPCEPKEARCPRANWYAQQFRILKEVANLSVYNPDGTSQNLTAKQRRQVVDALSCTNEMTFNQIRRLLDLHQNQEFNLEQGVGGVGRPKKRRNNTDTSPKRVRLIGNLVEHAAAKAFGKEWPHFPNEFKDDVRDLIVESEDREEFILRATKEWGLSLAAAERLADADLPDGYASYSLKAITRLNHELENGLNLECPLKEYEVLDRCDYNTAATWRVGRRYLPLPQRRNGTPIINNPAVRRGLFELRKVVNAIIRQYGKPKRIVVEIIRSMKQPLSRRRELAERQEANRKEREDAKKVLRDDFGKVNPTGTDILAYRLWKQQNWMSPYSNDPRSASPYSGRIISQDHMQSFLDGRGVLQIDHILPYSRTLDDSQNNKCLCFVDENLKKENQTPREWLNEETPAYAAMLARVAHMKDSGMPWTKRRRFSQKEVRREDFILRQLNDTAYLAREIRSYLKCLYSGLAAERDERVQVRPGHVTSALRHHWNLNTLLSPDGIDEKYRGDHRHHAIDAIVIGLTTPPLLYQLSQTDRALRAVRKPLPNPEGWESFREDVARAIEQINVSFRVKRRVWGKLHDDNPFRKTKKDGEFVIRKKLKDLTLSMIPDIVGDEVRQIVLKRLADHNILIESKSNGDDVEEGDDLTSSKKPPMAVWATPLYMTRKPGRHSPNPAQILSVRVIRRDKSIKKPSASRSIYVKPGSNHHVCLFKVPDEKGKLRLKAQFVTMLDAAKRLGKPVPIIDRKHPDFPEAEFVMSLSFGESVLLYHSGSECLCRFITAPITEELRFRHHCDAGTGRMIRKRFGQFRGRKVTIDPLGRIRWAND